MGKVILLAALWGSLAFSQTFTLGTLADPCTGGGVQSIAGTTGTVRYGDFTCTFTVPDGPYSVELDMLEPCFVSGACAGGQVKVGGRSQNVYVMDAFSLSKFDPVANGASNTAQAKRIVLAYAVGGKMIVRVETVKRSGVLAAVVLTSIVSGSSAQITREQCVGSGNGWNCAGLEKWTVTVGGQTQYWSAVPATAATWQLLPCPAPAPCLQPAQLGDPPVSVAGNVDNEWPAGSVSPVANLRCGISLYCYLKTIGDATSLWTDADIPGQHVPDPNPVTLGLKFQSDGAGKITGLRYYQHPANDGGHVGMLFTSAGAELARATWTGETGTGWQQVDFPSPVDISADTTYVAAYFSPTGFPWNPGFTGMDNPPLHALPGSNGVYKYGPSPQFPSDSAGANYWVDVVFSK